MLSYLLFFIGLNITSHLYLIRKDHEQVTKRDYVLLIYESLFITAALLMARYVYKYVTMM